MTPRRFLTVAVVLSAAVGTFIARMGVSTTAAAPGQSATGRDDQGDLAVTVYNSSLALVRDVGAPDFPWPGYLDGIVLAARPDGLRWRHGVELRVTDPAGAVRSA
mgnify:CR=1 FL=1